MDGGVVDLLPHGAVIQRGHDRLLGGIGQHEGVGSLLATLLCIRARLSQLRLAQTIELSLIVRPDGLSGQSIDDDAAKLSRQLRETGADLLILLAALLGEGSAVFLKSLVGILQQGTILALELIQLRVVDRLDAVEELLIEIKLIIPVGQHLGCLGLDLATSIGAVSGYQLEEDAANATQHGATLLERDDRILEGGRLLIVGDRLDLLALEADPLLKCGDEVLILDIGEVGCLEGQRARLEEGVVRQRLLLLGVASSDAYQAHTCNAC